MYLRVIFRIFRHTSLLTFLRVRDCRDPFFRLLGLGLLQVAHFCGSLRTIVKYILEGKFVTFLGERITEILKNICTYTHNPAASFLSRCYFKL